MKEQLDRICQGLCEKETSLYDIRQAARNMFDISSCNYTDYLLKSALNMIGAILQFANDLEHPPK